jgi:uncharacterized membrane protein
MQTELISPNLHVALIHFPLAMLGVGVMIEFFSFLWPRSTFRVAGRWMILLGALSAIPATFSGIYAFKAIAQTNMEANWHDLKEASPVLSQPAVWNMLRRHTLYQAIASGVAAVVVMVWLGASDRLRKSLHVLLVLILVVVVGAMIYGSWFGGEMVYHKAVAVQTTQPTDSADATATTVPTTMPAGWTEGPTQFEQQFPPIELHILFAGVCTALAVASIGLSFRRIHTAVDPMDEPIVTVSHETMAPRTPAAAVELVRSFNPGMDMSLRPHVPAGRFWMLTFVLALVTTLGGLWVIARDADILKDMTQKPNQIGALLWNQVKPGDGGAPSKAGEPAPKNYRHLAHAITGGAIVVLPIVLALLVRFAPRERIILSVVTFLLIVAVGLQVWFGILLWLDTSNGPLTNYNPPGSSVVS